VSLGASYASWLEYGTTRYFQFPTFTSKGLIHTRIDRHNLMQKETPMPIDRNPLNIMDPKIRRLSEFLFKMYHSNPSPNQHSRVSDTLAVNLAADPDAIMQLATLLAHVDGAPEEGEVTAFVMSPKSNVGSTPLLPNWLAEIMGQALGTTTIKEGDPGDTGNVENLIRTLMGQDREEHLYDEPLADDDGDLNHRVLWARVWQVLGGDEADVSFDPEYHECEMPGCRHPAIHGPGISPYTVNGAIMEVLDRANQMGLIDQALQCMADTQDEDGWVYHAGFVL